MVCRGMILEEANAFLQWRGYGVFPARKRAYVQKVPDCEKILKTLYEESR